MGILRWIIDSAAGALASSGAGADLLKQNKKYYWVSDSHRKKCNLIIQEANRNKNVLLLPWDKWNDCMQSHKRPLETYRVVKQITFVVNFIKELVGIDTGKEKFKEEKKIKDIPPTFQPIPRKKYPAPKKSPRPWKPGFYQTRISPSSLPLPEFLPKLKIPKEKIPKEKIPKEKAERKKIDGSKSVLNFGMFSGTFNLMKFIKPETLFKLMNIEKKTLSEIEEVGLNLIPPNRKDYSYLYTDVCRFNQGIFNTDKFS